MDLEQLKQEILDEMKKYFDAWSQWPGNPHTDGRAFGIDMGMRIVERKFNQWK